ncbi:2,3-dihydro-2,3-dihydroxybenzoate dehydrogenase [Antrihabitans cavernicola]|uniref:2,3-dihydro-2,3-dihydroxybenzoate dehydrogenase n=1 Tax=Antrihabitans cavernicola TaxID=2495913 RepID=A0A5A7S7H7_9NOCA|nr:2,3-dihydro-2,3-dihydroxybenzoate dehydrogenase [Spelaeibacter cavernicola]KAA0020128.1 2,3-dihydro-2,3-dihydroxybenzoate dehydrogenase [Spelaeibacter cavernicola]
MNGPRQNSTSGRIALVTGAAGGIGRRIVHRLAAEGMTVVAVDRAADALEGLHSIPGHILTKQGDVTDAGQVEAIVSDVERDIGPLDYLVNAVGILRVGELVELSDKDWDDMFAVNTNSVFLVTRTVAARMIPRRRGAIVTVSSNAAHTPRASMSAYSASKAAATMLARCAALEFAKYGIRCNVVSPGSTDTEMLQVSWEYEDRSAATIAGVPEQFRLGIPLGRIADADDIVDAVEFLLSDKAKHITMQQLTVDGGATLGV